MGQEGSEKCVLDGEGKRDRGREKKDVEKKTGFEGDKGEGRYENWEKEWRKEERGRDGEGRRK